MPPLATSRKPASVDDILGGGDDDLRGRPRPSPARRRTACRAAAGHADRLAVRRARGRSAPAACTTDRPSAATAPPRDPPAAAASSADAAQLLAAFLAGAGMGAGVGGVDVSREDPEAYLRSMGELMRLMIERIREVLMARAEVKRELGVEQTMLRPRNNNALKFSVTPEDAVAALLQPNRPGYLPPMQAAREALDDIGSHQLAVMAGVQTALFDLLKRFDPAALEKRLTGGSIFDNIMPAAKKARIWELFCATYKDIAREAEGGFQLAVRQGIRARIQ